MYLVLFVAALVCANLSVAMFGPWVSPINAFLLIGLDLSIRDKLHDKWSGNPVKIGGLIAFSGVVSYLLNPATGMIAIASVCAFCLSMIADSFVYEKLKHLPWSKKANASNVAGAFVDSLVFPSIAFGGLLWHIVALQFISKVAGGVVWCYLLNRSQEEHGTGTIR